MASNVKECYLNDLTHSILYEETPRQNLMRVTALVISVAVVLFFAWAAITQVNEMAQSKGEIIPSGYSQIVQHLEGGVVADILVEEGDLVNKGQILVRIGGVGAEEDYAQIRAKQTALMLQAERLRALLSGEMPDFATVENITPEEKQYQYGLLEAARQAIASEKEVLKKQIAQRQKTLAGVKARHDAAVKELSSGKELLTMQESLADKGYLVRRDLIESERDVAGLEGSLSSIVAQIAEAEDAISEYENRLTTFDDKHKENTLNELETINGQIAQNRESLIKLKSRVDRMTVQAPVRGLVKGLRINTIGGVIGAGEPIMEIVPLDNTLIVETQIRPRDVGNLKVGQPAKVKVSAYDFSRYGAIDGTLEFISATTFIGKNGESYYKGRISLGKNYVGNNPDRNLILPGMVVEADVITGQKTVLQYLLKPVHTSLASAMRER